MAGNRTESTVRIGAQLLNILAILLGIIAAYFVNIQSIKVELAAEAEKAMVETLDKKRGGFEEVLAERAVDREQFYRFATTVESRLSRIEYCVKQQSGDRFEEH